MKNTLILPVEASCRDQFTEGAAPQRGELSCVDSKSPRSVRRAQVLDLPNRRTMVGDASLQPKSKSFPYIRSLKTQDDGKDKAPQNELC